MFVKYYRRRTGRGASKTAAMGDAKKTLKSEKHISLRGEPPEEPTNTAKKEHECLHQTSGAWRGRMKQRAVNAVSRHWRAATCAV